MNFFGETQPTNKENKSIIANQLVQEYKKDRQRFIDCLIQRHVEDMEKQINNESRYKGKTTTCFNFINSKIDKEINNKEFPNINFESLSDDEKEFILDKLCKYLEKEGFAYSIPESTQYSSMFYRMNITINWGSEE